MGEKLGQHFLKSSVVVKDIIRSSKITRNDTILEIGPGKGVLTKELVGVAKKVIAVEKDTALATYLKKTIKNDNLDPIEKDILKYYPKIKGNYKIVANIPYYITGKILRKFLQTPNRPTSITLLLQNEVAKRIVAKDKKESVLSMSVKAYGTPKYIKKVNKSYFHPRPKVDSAILHISDISDNFFKENKVSEKEFFRILKMGFSHKRKKVGKNLGVDKNILEKCSIRENARAENLNLNDWACLKNTKHIKVVEE